MATVTTPTVLDEVTARTAGEAWTLNTGGSLTIKTDTRWHAKAPASMTGSLGNISCTDGDLLIDATSVRWLEITGGSGTLAIGATISQGGVSGYFLGFWSSLTAAPSLTLGASGFIKFRQVTGGTFTAGALTGATATAVGPDKVGWIEVVIDQALTITVPRLGSFTTRGDWFELGETNGSVGQQLQVPTNGGGVGTHVPAVWIETSPGSDTYEIYPALNTWTNGWSYKDMSSPASEIDARQKFVSTNGSGVIQIGSSGTQTGTYANIASQASTYATVAHTGTYTWANNKVSVYCSGGHYLKTGESTGLDFTSGSATDGIFVVTVLDVYNFEVTLAGSGTGGNVTSRAFIAITFTAHANHIGFQLYCDFTTGSGVDGVYTVAAVNGANVVWVTHPHTVALTSGAVTVYRGATLTYGAVHNMSIGQRADITFTSGTGVSGIYTLETIPSTTTAFVNIPLNMTGGNFTVNLVTGYIPPAGCKVRVPNIFGRQCVNTTRSVNAAPHGTITSRPEFATTSAGYIDIDFMMDDWYYNLSQPYYVRYRNSATFDQFVISECATSFELDNFAFGMYSALDAVTLPLLSNFAGGYIGYGKAMRGNVPGATDHAVTLTFCNNVTIDGLECGIVQYPRNTGFPLYLSTCTGITIESVKTLNGGLSVVYCNTVNIKEFDYCDRFVGYTNNTGAAYAITLNTCNDVTVANVTFGEGFTIPNCHPSGGVMSVGGSNRIKLRNVGTQANPVPVGSWAPNYAGFTRFFNTTGNNNTIKIQELYAETGIATWGTTVNSDKNVLVENVHYKWPWWIAARAHNQDADANLNCTRKNVCGIQTLTGQASVYGTHWNNRFSQTGWGQLMISMNEPTAETLAQVTTISGTPKFNSAGGVILPTIGNEAVWETPDWIRGTTFRNVAPAMSGGTIGNYALTYAINTGAGYGAFKTLNGANLSAEVIPDTGFKLKVSIRTTTTNTTAITYLQMFTFNDPIVAAANPYPFDTITLSINGLEVGSDITILQAGTETVLSNTEDYGGTTFNYVYETPTTVDIVVNKPGFYPAAIRNYVLETSDASVPIIQPPDLSYID